MSKIAKNRFLRITFFRAILRKSGWKRSCRSQKNTTFSKSTMGLKLHEKNAKNCFLAIEHTQKFKV